MPIHWTISPEKRLVVATTEGVVTLKDVETYLDALVVADAMPYAKLFDASNIEPQATDHDVLMLGARMSAYVKTLPGGPLAFVVTTRVAREFALVEGISAVARGPIVFLCSHGLLSLLYFAVPVREKEKIGR